MIYKLMLYPLASLIMLQVVAPDLSPFVTPIERFTLVGALIIAVKVLWTSNKEKEKVVLDIAKRVTETITKTNDSVLALIKTTDELGNAIDQLTNNVSLLTDGKSFMKDEKHTN